MTRSKTNFICQNCNNTFLKWVGRCENCGEWNTLLEQVIENGKSALARAVNSGKILNVKNICQITASEGVTRYQTGFSDLDDLLGGGIVAGGVVLLAGQPGIGKSTLLLQISAFIAQKKSVLYVSGEESASQVKIRALRLGADNREQLSFVTSTNTNDISATIKSAKYDLVIIDSIQTLSLEELSSAPGTVSQITNSANMIARSAKETNSSIVLVGHVTKEGSIAGPKVLEHMVDVVLNFEGDRYGGFKVVRSVKNRFGSTSEVAIFDMGSNGLRIVKNPSASLLAERQNVDGSVVLATLEGNKPLLVEIQALTTTSSFGYPKRTASGIDINRLNLLIAVLERRTKLSLADKDIYVNVVGGIKLNDPASDLAICVAIASATTGLKLDDYTVVFGEVGLGGEIRSASLLEQRLKEATKLGFKRAIGPAGTSSKSILIGMKDLKTVLNTFLKRK